MSAHWRPIELHEVPFLEAFGAALRVYRHAAGLTQAKLASLTGFSWEYVSLLERGRRRPRPATIADLAGALATDGDPQPIIASLTAVLGPVSATEARHPVTLEQRRRRRAKREQENAKLRALAYEIARDMHEGGVGYQRARLAALRNRRQQQWEDRQMRRAAVM